MDRKLKIGVIGVGSIAQCHITAYAANPHVELYALQDVNREFLEARGKEHGVQRLYTDLDEMLALPELDAVSVCTWNCAHASCAIAALEAGKHVLCEKPMALNADDALRMKQAADKAKKLLMIGFVRRYSDDTAAMKRFAEAGAFGDVYYAKASYLRRNGAPGGWFGDKTRSGGGPLIDLGVHVIDLVRYVMGNPQPVSVYASTFYQLPKHPPLYAGKAYTAAVTSGKDVFNVEDLATAMIRFDNGATLAVDTSFNLHIREDRNIVEIFGTKGGARLAPELEIYGEANGYLTNTTLDQKLTDFSGMFQNEIDHFVDCLLTGAPCRSPAEDGLALMRILDAAYESARTGDVVRI